MKRYFLPILTAGILMSSGILRAQTCTSLVTNPDGSGGATGWSFYNGGDDGIATLTDNGTDCFVYSYAWDSQTQLIDLENTYTAAQLATRPNITFSEQLKTWSGAPCSNSGYTITVMLSDSSNNVLETWTTGSQTTTSNTVWETIAHSFVAYGGTPRYVTIVNEGGDCSVWAGNYGVAFTAISLTALMPSATAGTATATQNPNSVISYDDPSSCLQTGVVLATATSGLGTTTVKSFEDTAVSTYNGQPYLQRHFEISPGAQNTASVTLYVDQADFTAYNLVRGAYPALPASGDTTDQDLSNLIITAFHGTPTGGYDPGNYPVAARELIPNSAITKVWNADADRWEFTFPISNFSGFFFSSGGATPLDIHMGELALATRNGHHSLSWTTYNEAAADYFIIERSTDGKSFAAISKIQCTGKPGAYAFNDAATPAGLSHYRLKLISGKSGAATYSNVVTGRVSAAAIDIVSAFPMPASGVLNVRLNGSQDGTATLSLNDAAGKELKRIQASGSVTQMDISGVPAGIYFLSCRLEAGASQTIKVVVE